MTTLSQPRLKRFQPWVITPEEETREDHYDGRGMRSLIHFVDRASTKLAESELGKHLDITYAQWRFLRVLWAQDGLSQRELSQRVGLMENSTVIAINVMEARGWIKRQRDEADKRRLCIYLTEEGRSLANLRAVAQNVGRIATRGMSSEMIAILRQGLQQMLANMEDALEANAKAAKSQAPHSKTPLPAAE
jgi:DNA-binding MarR family transcriptional regulator